MCLFLQNFLSTDRHFAAQYFSKLKLVPTPEEEEERGNTPSHYVLLSASGLETPITRWKLRPCTEKKEGEC